MALKYIAGTLPSIGVYAIVPGLLQRLPSGRWDLNSSTVSSVDLVGAGKEYNYAKGGMGMFAGAAIAGPVGMLVGGLAPKAFKDDVVQFVIRFHSGDVAHFAGSKGDYKRALNSSYKGVTAAPSSAAPPAAEATVGSEGPNVESEAAELERLRAEVAKLRAGQEPKPEPAAPAPSLLPPSPRPIADGAYAGIVAAREARDAQAEALDGHSRLWFAGAAERKYVKAPVGESESERRQREAQNEQYRKEYKAALQVLKKQHEKDIQNNHGLKFRERMRLLNEIQREFTYRTAK